MVAAVSLAGIFLDVLGGLYLAYDLLGGQHGPLRLLTRIVTYSMVFGIGYGIGLGLFFGVACGLATGITVSIELQRTARRGDHYPLGWEAVFSAIRGLAFGAGLYRILGLIRLRGRNGKQGFLGEGKTCGPMTKRLRSGQVGTLPQTVSAPPRNRWRS